MDRLPQDPGRWSPALEPPASITVPALVAARALDAELAALLWITVEANLPLIVAGTGRPAFARAVLDAFLDLVPPATRRLELQGDRETFDWLADAAALGWEPAGSEPAGAGANAVAGGPGRGPGLAPPPRRPAPPETTFLVAGDLGAETPAGISGMRARVLIRALQRGYGLAATVHAASLEQVLAVLGAPPASVGADELRRLGVVLVLGRARAAPGAGEGGRARADPGAAAGGAPEGSSTDIGAPDPAAFRVVACHYVRPVERDVAGHLQRRPPAILATWDREHDEFEHFEWGITAELAMRVGMSRDEFEHEHVARSRLVAGLVASGRTSPEALGALLSRRPRPRTGGDA